MLFKHLLCHETDMSSILFIIFIVKHEKHLYLQSLKVYKLKFLLGYTILKYSDFKLHALFAFASRVLYNAKAQALSQSGR